MSTREERARKLVQNILDKNALQFFKQEGETYKITSAFYNGSSNTTIYTVTRNSCNCKDRQYHSEFPQCKHMIALNLLLETKRVVSTLVLWRTNCSPKTLLNNNPLLLWRQNHAKNV